MTSRSVLRGKFTLADCNTMLPLVRSVANEITERRRRRSRILREREQLEAARTPEGLSLALNEADARVADEEDGIQHCCVELEHYGLTVLRLNPLVVHFPGRTRDDQVVFCWQEGESTVSHGHPQGEEEEPRFPLKLKQ